jgi:hypothetical protein
MTAENLALARSLWDEGVSATAIGRRLDVGKNAILSYAHRRGWPPRPSPLGRRKGDGPKPAPKPKVESARREACKPEPLAVPTASFGSCQWPLSICRPWQFCGAPAVKGAWCAEHHAVAYMARPRLVAA